MRSTKHAITICMIAAGGGDASVLVHTQDPPIVYGWSPDGKKVIYWHGQPILFSALDVETRKTTDLIAHPQYNIHGAELSPDQQWVAFHTPLVRSSPIWIAPVRNGEAARDSEWIKVIDRGVLNSRPWWSPDGKLLYFISALDGFRCIWAQRLAAGKQPLGEPFPVCHLHSARMHTAAALASFGPAILPDGIIFSLIEETGNVWVGEKDER